MDEYARGTRVVSRTGSHEGRLTGGRHMCATESCSGERLGVRWDDGKLTFPCTKDMLWQGDHWRLLPHESEVAHEG